MTSFLHLRQCPTEIASDALRHPDPDRDHGFDLPVAVLGHGAERDANDVVLVDFEFRDQVDVKGRCALVEEENRLFRGSELSDTGHAASYVAGRVDWRARRAAIVEFNRMAEGGL